MICPYCHVDELKPLRSKNLKKVEYCNECNEYFLNTVDGISRVTKSMAIEEYGARHSREIPLIVMLLGYILYTALFFSIAAYLYNRFNHNRYDSSSCIIFMVCI